ncbi:MAG: tetratricopeptide repeat protein [Desulfuromonadaceae bacterium]|nr:tetratricopeptide repeat protein [Desulfuromonadaceae bacterium]
MLLPVIGLIQVGEQSIADRYTYIPIIGLFIMIAWGTPDVIKRSRYRSEILLVLTIVVIAISSMVTWNQLKYWQNGFTLFQHATDVTEKNCVAHYNLGAALIDRGDVDGGIREFTLALAINPNNAEVHNNLAIALDKKGDVYGAISEFKQSLKINPRNFETHYNLGIALLKNEVSEEAILEFRKALEIIPNESRAQYYLGRALANKNK